MSLLQGQSGQLGPSIFERSWFGRPKDDQLCTPKRDRSQHNTLRHDQVERRRKVARRAGRKLPGYKYRKAVPA